MRRLVRGLLMDGGQPRRVLVAGGATRGGEAAAALVNAHRDWGLEVAGLVTDGRWDETARTDFPVLGSYPDLYRLVQEQHAAEVLIAPAMGQLGDLHDIAGVIATLEEQGTVVRLSMNFLPRSISQPQLRSAGRRLPAPHVLARRQATRCSWPCAGWPTSFIALSLLVLLQPGAVRHRRRCQAGVAGPGAVPAGALRPARPAFHVPEVPHDADRRGTAEAAARASSTRWTGPRSR